ncbi:MAG: succinylglutamate desuccinylase/aspartoacylase family protein [Acidobacteriaceae bacterium]
MRKMEVSQFRPNAFAPGTRHRLHLSVDEAIALPVLLAVGAATGKTLVVTANIHGDEYEGVRAILEVFDDLDPSRMTGNLIAVPVANPPAFWQGTRTSPVDGLNMARIMPGKPDGTTSERIAYALSHNLLAHADFYLDLHSGGITYRMPSMVGYSSTEPRSYAAAEIFGASVVWGHAAIAPGRTISYAQSQGIPWLYTEARGAGRIHPDDLKMMKTGIRNLLQHLGILPGEVAPAEIQWRLTGGGNTDDGISATKAGFLLHAVQILQEVAEGELLGSLVSTTGDLLEEYRAGKAGIVGMIREFPVVQPDDSLFLIADRNIS